MSSCILGWTIWARVDEALVLLVEQQSDWRWCSQRWWKTLDLNDKAIKDDVLKDGEEILDGEEGLERRRILREKENTDIRKTKTYSSIPFQRAVQAY